jgi:hypothetical protein
MMSELLAMDHAAVASASRILTSRYRNFVTYEDVQQELYLWLLSHYDRAERWRAEYSEKHAERTLVKALRNAGERYCRTEKAEFEGYTPDDEFFYSIPMVADLLRLSFDPEWVEPTSPIKEEDEYVGGARPANENLVAMVADVGRALRTLPVPDQRLLRRAYGQGVETADVVAQLGLEWDISAHAADSRLRRVVGRVRAALGGPSPYQESHADQ